MASLRSRSPRIPRPTEIARRVLRQIRLLARMGPVHYAEFRNEVRASTKVGGHTFANGVTTTLTAGHARVWQRVWGKPVVVALIGEAAHLPVEWAERLSRELHMVTVIGTGGTIAYRSRHQFEPNVEAPAEVLASGDLSGLWEWMVRAHRRHDLVILDLANPLPDVMSIARLQHAAHAYHHDGAVGFIVPAYVLGTEHIAGWNWDAMLGRFVAMTVPEADYGQLEIPRWVLTAAPHGLYATSQSIDRIGVPDTPVGSPLGERVADVVRRGWLASVRTLCFSPVVMEISALPEIGVDDAQRKWLLDRRATRNGRTRIVFVLNATSVSGGIRIVFELANGLHDRGFDVEVFSVQGQPEWFDLRASLRRYRSYEDLALALRDIDAIKVATWWETADIVWLASVTHGIPAYLVQEFETWFYPDQPVAQAAVVASYRPEFRIVTEATYQRAELAEVGARAALIPNGYDSTVFRVVAGVDREEDSVLALGRSFFQKNFAMTLNAWRSMGPARPRLVLFGTEPDIVDDLRAEYHERPTDAEVNLLYNRAAIFVQTSRHEGFCLPILEAMAAGCPVIATDSHGNRDFCIDGENCIIVPQDDPAALADAIRGLLADPQRRQRLADAGLETAKRYEWSRVLDEVAEYYENLASAASSP